MQHHLKPNGYIGTQSVQPVHKKPRRVGCAVPVTVCPPRACCVPRPMAPGRPPLRYGLPVARRSSILSAPLPGAAALRLLFGLRSAPAFSLAPAGVAVPSPRPVRFFIASAALRRTLRSGWGSRACHRPPHGGGGRANCIGRPVIAPGHPFHNVLPVSACGPQFSSRPGLCAMGEESRDKQRFSMAVPVSRWGNSAEIQQPDRCCSVFVLTSGKPETMAKVLYTAVVADMRNKLNGSVFSKNRYGAYVRTKVTPVNPQSTYQQQERQNFGNTSASWRGLTQAQRNAWIAQAQFFPVIDIFGNSKVLSGQALYTKLNRNLYVAGQSSISAPPAPATIPAFFITGVVADVSSGFVISVNVATIPAGFTCIVAVTDQLTPGIGFAKNRFRVLGVFPATANDITITTEYAARFGALVATNKVFVRVYLISNTTGQASTPSEESTIVIP